MYKIPRLDCAARRRLINRGRKINDPQTALRIVMIAKLGQGLSRQQVARDLACWPSTVVEAARRFAEAGELCLWDSARRKRALVVLRRLVKNATAAEPAFHADEMGVHLNPKSCRAWIPEGHRRYFVTPGQNKERFVAGALNATTKKLTWMDAPTKASDLLCKVGWKLGAEYRDARRIDLIVDYIIHSNKKTRRFLRGERCC